MGWGSSNFNSWADMTMHAAVDTGRAPRVIPIDGDRFLLGQFTLAYAGLLVADVRPSETAAARSRMAALLPRIARTLPIERPDDTTTIKWLERAMAQADALAALAEGRDTAGLELLRKADQAERRFRSSSGRLRWASRARNCLVTCSSLEAARPKLPKLMREHSPQPLVAAGRLPGSRLPRANKSARDVHRARDCFG